MAIQDARPSPYTQLTTAAELEKWFSCMGIFEGVDEVPGGTGLQPSLDSGGRNAVMAAGKAIIKGQLWSCDTSVSTSIPAASGQNRIDRLVLRLNRVAGTAATFVAPAIIQGTPSGSPVIPDLVRTDSTNYDIPISHWTSASTGALTGLVDDRQFIGLSVTVGTSTNRPTVTKPRLLVETDTNDLRLWNGSSWVKLNAEQPTAWQNMGSMKSGWSIGDYAKYKKTGEGLLVIAFSNLNCNGATNGDGTQIWSAANGLNSGYRPQTDKHVHCRAKELRQTGTNHSMTGTLAFRTDGSVDCYGISDGCDRVDLFATIPIDV